MVPACTSPHLLQELVGKPADLTAIQRVQWPRGTHITGSVQQRHHGCRAARGHARPTHSTAVTVCSYVYV